MRRVTDMDEEPEVGKFYLVPCVLYKGVWTAVFGPLHDDRDLIGVEADHYHRDVRFADDDECEWLGSRFAEPSAEQCALFTIVITDHIESEIAYKRRKCRRRMPEFPHKARRNGAIGGPSEPPWLRILEDAYRGANAKCGRCPHRGFNLKGLPQKDGKVVCPGHGLRWHVRTGALAPRC